MSIQFNQFEQLVTGVLKEYPKLYADGKGVDILMLTAAVESDGCSYFQQINGPAISFFQLEPATIDDILRYVKQSSKRNIELAQINNNIFEEIFYYSARDYQNGALLLHIELSILLARIKYWMDPKPLGNTIEEHAATWKRVYNTELGKGKPEEAIKKYNTWKTKGFIR